MDEELEEQMSTEQTDATAESAPAAPVLRIITPSTTPEEVAAIVAVFSAMGGGAADSRRPRSRWASPRRHLELMRGAAVPPFGRSGADGWSRLERN